MQRTTQPVQVRPVQPGAVDLSRRDDLHGDTGCAREHRPEQLLTVLRRDLLRVVQLRERPNAMVAERVVVEKNAGDDERAGERAAARSSAPATKRAPSLRSNFSSLCPVFVGRSRLFCFGLSADSFFGNGLLVDGFLDGWLLVDRLVTVG
jgi:hypothetical protein